MRPVPEERHPPAPTRRDVQVVQIPDGTTATLPAGTVVTVTQTLGTSYTVRTERGARYRVAGRDGDAIRMPILTEKGFEGVPQTVEGVSRAARQALGQVYDPEIPVDIVNLGLVHELTVAPRPAGGFAAKVRMGLTSPGCGMGDVLVQDVGRALRAIPGVEEVDAQVVLFPVWNPQTMMSDAAKLKLGLL